MNDLSEKVRRGLLDLLGQDTDLGFGPVPSRAVTVYVAQKDDCLWYTWDRDAEERRPITAPSLTGTVDEVAFLTVERGGEWVHKARFYVEADRRYALECGADTTFSRCLLEALDQLTADELTQHLTIGVQEGDSKSVVLPNLYAGGALVTSEGSGRSWQQIGYAVAQKLGGGKEAGKAAFEYYQKDTSQVQADRSPQRGSQHQGPPSQAQPPRGQQRQEQPGRQAQPPRGQQRPPQPGDEGYDPNADLPF